MNDDKVDLTLQTICEGDLDKWFNNTVPEIINQLDKNEKGSMSIMVNFERLKDTDTIIAVSFKAGFKLPNKKRASICNIEEFGTLTTDKAPEKPFNLFEMNTEKEGTNNE